MGLFTLRKLQELRRLFRSTPGPEASSRLVRRPHRVCLGGALASAPEGNHGLPTAPTELVSVERRLGDKKDEGTALPVQKPPLHRDWLGGGGDDSRFPLWCRSPRSTETSSVGAKRGHAT